MTEMENILALLDSAAKGVVELLCKNKLTISTAESCTGGMLSQYITSVSGASDVFEYGICSYSERIKMQELSVEKQTLLKYSVVSDEVARQMACGVKAKSGADIGVGITGIAGPGGGTQEKPVGTVFVAVCYKDKFISKDVKAYKTVSNPDRDMVRRMATYEAFKMIEEIISK